MTKNTANPMIKKEITETMNIIPFLYHTNTIITSYN